MTDPTPAEALKAEPTPAEIIAFLNGEAALEGLWFGNRPERGGAFWWRKYLPILTRPPAADADEPATCILCKGACRGHSLGHPEEWEPEKGSAADAGEVREGVEGILRKALSEECAAVGHSDGKSRTKIIIEARNAILALSPTSSAGRDGSGA